MIFNTNKDATIYYKNLSDLFEKQKFVKDLFDHKIIEKQKECFISHFLGCQFGSMFVYNNIDIKRVCHEFTDLDHMAEIMHCLINANNIKKAKKLYKYLHESPNYTKSDIYWILIDAMCCFDIFYRHNTEFVEKVFHLEKLKSIKASDAREIKKLCYVMMLAIVVNTDQRKIYLYTKKLAKIGFTWKYIENDRQHPEAPQNIDIRLIYK